MPSNGPQDFVNGNKLDYEDYNQSIKSPTELRDAAAGNDGKIIHTTTLFNVFSIYCCWPLFRNKEKRTVQFNNSHNTVNINFICISDFPDEVSQDMMKD